MSEGLVVIIALVVGHVAGLIISLVLRARLRRKKTYEPTRSLFSGWTTLRARDGEIVRVLLEGRSLIVVVDSERGDELGRASVISPGAGYAGHELVLSAEEHYLAMGLYSGQSEVGYELFTFRPKLEHIGSFPYAHGYGFAPVFSPDEKRVAIAWATDPSLTVEDQDVDDAGLTTSECIVDWACVHVRELPDGGEQQCAIRVRVPAGFPWKGDSSYYPERLELLADEVRFETAWGTTVRLPRPLPESLVVGGPAHR